MDQNDTPLLDALRAIERRPLSGFGAPGHSQGGAIPSGLKRLLGRRVFEADVLTPKGLDDRTEGKLALQRAHEIAAEAWGADFCRYVTGGSTQSLHSVLAAVAGPGDTLLVAQNAHKAEWSYALAAGIDLAVLPVAYDADWDIELGVRPETLAAALDRHPEAKAAVVVSPNYYGVTSDVPALAALCHARGIPLIVDAAWGGAFAFSPALPVDALAAGADAQVCSLHKTLGALAQGSVILARGDLLDRQRLWMAYELFETTSPSVPILASLEATRRDHAVDGEKLWADVLSLATAARASIAAIDGLRVYSRNDLPAGADLDETKILVDVGALGVGGYAIDDWLYANHRVSVGLSDARHLLMVIGLGTRRRDVHALVKGLRALVETLAADPDALPRLPGDLPRVDSLHYERAMPGPRAFAGAVETVRWEEAAGRIAAEMIAPAPPGVPRLVPGQRITADHVAFLVANQRAGAFVLDPVDPTGETVRVVAS